MSHPWVSVIDGKAHIMRPGPDGDFYLVAYLDGTASSKTDYLVTWTERVRQAPWRDGLERKSRTFGERDDALFFARHQALVGRGTAVTVTARSVFSQKQDVRW